MKIYCEECFTLFEPETQTEMERKKCPECERKIREEVRLKGKLSGIAISRDSMMRNPRCL